MSGFRPKYLPSNRRRCVKGRPSYKPSNPLLSSDVIEKQKKNVFCQNEESFMKSIEPDSGEEESITIDLSAFLNENPYIAEAAFESCTENNVAATENSSQFIITDCKDYPSESHTDIFSTSNSVDVNRDISENYYISEKIIAPLDTASLISINDSLTENCLSPQKILPNTTISEPAKNKTLRGNKSVISPLMKYPKSKGHLNSLKKYENFMKSKDLNKTNEKNFKKYPVKKKCDQKNILDKVSKPVTIKEKNITLEESPTNLKATNVPEDTMQSAFSSTQKKKSLKHKRVKKQQPNLICGDAFLGKNSYNSIINNTIFEFENNFENVSFLHDDSFENVPHEMGTCQKEGNSPVNYTSVSDCNMELEKGDDLIHKTQLPANSVDTFITSGTSDFEDSVVNFDANILVSDTSFLVGIQKYDKELFSEESKIASPKDCDISASIQNKSECAENSIDKKTKGKFFENRPVVECEKLDIENFVKNNKIKGSNWTLLRAENKKGDEESTYKISDSEKMAQFVMEEKNDQAESNRLQRKLQMEVERREALRRHLPERETSLEMEEESYYNEKTSAVQASPRAASSPVPHKPLPNSSRPLSPDSEKMAHFAMEEKQDQEESIRLQRKLQMEVEREALRRHLPERETSLKMEEESYYNEKTSAVQASPRAASSPVPHNPLSSSSRPLSPDSEKMAHFAMEEKQDQEESIRLQRKLQMEVEREALRRHLPERETSLEMEEESYYNEKTSAVQASPRAASSPVPHNPLSSSSRPLSPDELQTETKHAAVSLRKPVVMLTSAACIKEITETSDEKDEKDEKELNEFEGFTEVDLLKAEVSVAYAKHRGILLEHFLEI